MSRFQKWMSKIFSLPFCHREKSQFILFKPCFPLKKYWHNDPALSNHYILFNIWQKHQPYPLAFLIHWLGYSPCCEWTGRQFFLFSTHGTWELHQGGKFHSETWASKSFRDVQHPNSEVPCIISVAFCTSSTDYTFLFTSWANIKIISYYRTSNS